MMFLHGSRYSMCDLCFSFGNTLAKFKNIPAKQHTVFVKYFFNTKQNCLPTDICLSEKQSITLSPRTYLSQDKKTRLDQCKGFVHALLALGGTGCLRCWCCYGKLEGFLQPEPVTTASLMLGDSITNKTVIILTQCFGRSSLQIRQSRCYLQVCFSDNF